MPRRRSPGIGLAPDNQADATYQDAHETPSGDDRTQDPETGQYIPLSDNPESSGSADPMRTIFGGPTFASPDEDNDAPEEIVDLFQAEGLSDRGYNCMLKQTDFPNAGQISFIKTLSNHYPSHEWIANNYGPGNYVLYFRWRAAPDNFGVRKNKSASVYITISDKLKQQYLDYQLQLRLERLSQNRQKIRDAQMEKIMEEQMIGLDPPGATENRTGLPSIDPKIAAKAYIAEALETAKSLGLTTGRQGVEWDKLLPAILTGLPMIMKMFQDSAERRDQQRQDMMNLMISMNSNSSSQLIELMKAQTGPTKGQDMMKEWMDMLKGALNIKELFADKEESLADKVFGLVESIAPHLLAVLALPPAQRAVDPRMQFARNFAATSPDIKALAADPEELGKFVRNLDAFFGWEQADVILQVMGNGNLLRPANAPRLPNQQYPQGDPRNNAGAVEQEPPESPENEDASDES